MPPRSAAGEFVQVTGSWLTDRTHGLEFRASFLRATSSTTTEAIQRYLGSGKIRDIGPRYTRPPVQVSLNQPRLVLTLPLTIIVDNGAFI